MTKKTVDRTKGLKQQETKMGTFTAAWVAGWFLCFFISFFVPSLETIMFFVVWAPVAVLVYILIGDLAVAADEQRYKPLTFSAGYLALYLWLLEMTPE